ncbi:MAG: GyrI-like domain-containing protein [Ornithinimicrobium sp.]|uniref:GyrI-like domain-containing protein n=1 Tax=Ornithinimicrobium sp. TaxID=1977084 RepID=UPI0026DF2A99|nr:GyrI-like domain-containing protein [Ornithinimicrobium sp.]MDO5739666.1 GyrI-like domain-containing protein [Ornithinimicrobium sp.]
MLTPLAFARHGHVRAATLSDLRARALLVPTLVDPDAGAGGYDARQLPELNRLLAKEPGIDSSEAAWRRSLQEADRCGLAITEKALPATLVLQRWTRVEDPTQIDHAIVPLWAALSRDLRALGIRRTEPTIAWYDDAPPRSDLRLGVAYPIRPGLEPAVDHCPGLELATLEPEARAVTTLHHGSLGEIIGTWQSLEIQVAEQGLRPRGRCREIYLAKPTGRPHVWVTELQQPVQ